MDDAKNIICSLLRIALFIKQRLLDNMLDMLWNKEVWEKISLYISERILFY